MMNKKTSILCVTALMAVAGCAFSGSEAKVTQYDGMTYAQATEMLGLDGYACTLSGTTIEPNGSVNRKSVCFQATENKTSSKCNEYQAITLDLEAFTMSVRKASKSRVRKGEC